MIKKNKLFVFDIDDTLTKTAKLHQIAFIDSLQKMGVEEMDTNFGEYKHHTDSYIAKEIYEKDRGITFTADKLKLVEKLLMDYLLKHPIEEIKGAKHIINQIESDSSYGVCFATGSLLEPAKYKLDQISIDNYDSRLVASNSLVKREQIVQAAIDKAKVHYGVNHFEQIISVGDGLWDLNTANKLNIKFIGIGNKNYEVLREKGAKLLWKDFSYFDFKEIEANFH